MLYFFLIVAAMCVLYPPLFGIIIGGVTAIVIAFILFCTVLSLFNGLAK